MEEKSILIQSDEVTKNIMSEIQDDMSHMLSKISKNMSEEVIEKLRPIEKKVSDLKGNFQEFQEEEFEEKLEELTTSLSKIAKTMESSVEMAVNKVIAEQNKTMFESIEQRLAILGLKVVKDVAANKEAILNKIDGINVERVHEKVDILEKSIGEKVESLERIVEEKYETTEKAIGNNIDNNTDIILGKIKNIDNKIKDKEIIIELINKLEDELNEKIYYIQEEVEWGNKSFFARLFGKRRK